MARYEMKLPDEIMKDVEKIHKDAPQMFEKMTHAGAEVAYKNILRNMKSSFKDTSMLEQHLKITKPYRTYQGHNVNTKVAFYGYYRKNNKDYINRQHRNATEKFKYKTGKDHKSTRTGGRKEANYEYKQEGVPVPLIVIAREYGTSSGEAKKPFVRRSFKKNEIEAVMRKIQKEESGGLLE